MTAFHERAITSMLLSRGQEYLYPISFWRPSFRSRHRQFSDYTSNIWKVHLQISPERCMPCCHFCGSIIKVTLQYQLQWHLDRHSTLKWCLKTISACRFTIRSLVPLSPFSYGWSTPPEMHVQSKSKRSVRTTYCKYCLCHGTWLPFKRKKPISW